MNIRHTLVIVMLTLPAMAKEEMPKEDVIELPAIGEGLWVSNLFQSKMVVQRDKPIAVWGWADAGESVTVSFAGNQASATAGKDRYWQTQLPALPATAKPQAMVIKGKNKTVTLENILIGDVWVLGGQSNMEFPLSKVENGNLEIAGANYPEIRILTMPPGNAPHTHLRAFPILHQYSSWFKRHYHKGSWDVCSPEIATELSAIGYVFARHVHKASGVPIGVIDTSRGGTTVESWTPLARLREMESKPTQALLADWDEQVANFDGKADLAKRIEHKKKWIAGKQKKGEKIPPHKMIIPSEISPGPIDNQNHPGSCYGGIIAPLEGLSIKGAIFHQGYNNAFSGQQGIDLYADVFPVMIEAWRDAFKDPEMPFGILSLCTADDPQQLENYSEMMFDAGVGLRAAQYQTYLDLKKAGDKNVGFVSTYDLRRRFYHPQLKAPAGLRAARWALASQYGLKQLAWKPPEITGMEAKDGSLALSFDNKVQNPADGPILGFAIAGENREFHPATARYAITGKDSRGRDQEDKSKLILSSMMVPEPIHFRYAWSRNPMANLQLMYFKDVPLATQRSDNWRLAEVPLSVVDPEHTESTKADRGKILNALRELDKQRRIKEAKETLKAHSAQ